MRVTVVDDGRTVTMDANDWVSYAQASNKFHNALRDIERLGNDTSSEFYNPYLARLATDALSVLADRGSDDLHRAGAGAEERTSRTPWGTDRSVRLRNVEAQDQARENNEDGS